MQSRSFNVILLACQAYNTVASGLFLAMVEEDSMRLDVRNSLENSLCVSQVAKQPWA